MNLQRFWSGAPLILALTVATPAAAQLSGLPTRNAGIGSGLSVGAEIGMPDADYGDGTAYGARAALGFGAFGVSALLSSYDPDGSIDSYTTIGGALNLKVIGGPLIPLAVTLQAGVESADPSGSASVLHAPIGVGISLTIPNPAVAIKPWLAPRVDLVRVSGGDTESNFGLSGGVDFSLIWGLTLALSYDRVWADNSQHPSVVGVGAGWNFHIPGL